MKIRNYLDFVINGNIWKLLRVFITLPNAYTGRQMSSITGMHHNTCISYLEHLHNEGLVLKKIAGRSYLYSLCNNYFINKVIAPLLQQEQKLFSHIKTRINRTFNKYCTAIIIYGSYVRFEESSDSDLDICFIVPKKTKGFEERLDTFIQEIKDSYTLTISPHILTETEVVQKKNLSVLQDIKNEGEWINGDKTDLVKRLW